MMEKEDEKHSDKIPCVAAFPNQSILIETQTHTHWGSDFFFFLAEIFRVAVKMFSFFNICFPGE